MDTLDMDMVWCYLLGGGLRIIVDFLTVDFRRTPFPTFLSTLYTAELLWTTPAVEGMPCLGTGFSGGGASSFLIPGHDWTTEKSCTTHAPQIPLRNSGEGNFGKVRMKGGKKPVGTQKNLAKTIATATKCFTSK